MALNKGIDALGTMQKLYPCSIYHFRERKFDCQMCQKKSSPLLQFISDLIAAIRFLDE